MRTLFGGCLAASGHLVEVTSVFIPSQIAAREGQFSNITLKETDWPSVLDY